MSAKDFPPTHTTTFVRPELASNDEGVKSVQPVHLVWLFTFFSEFILVDIDLASKIDFSLVKKRRRTFSLYESILKYFFTSNLL